jgi:predicted amidohydrolase YtcJ
LLSNTDLASLNNGWRKQAFTLTVPFDATLQRRLGFSIQPGQLADLVVRAQDPFKTNPSELLKIQVERTMVGGNWKYES